MAELVSGGEPTFEAEEGVLAGGAGEGEEDEGMKGREGRPMFMGAWTEARFEGGE